MCSFIFQSCISIIITILLNKGVISILNDNINQKKFLYGIAGISLSASFVSTFFSFIHSYLFKKKNKEAHNKDFQKVNTNKDIQDFKSKDSKKIKTIKVKNQKLNNNEGMKISEEDYKSSERQNLGESKRNEREDEETKETKTCLFCGYLFYQKTTKNKKNKKNRDICVLYKYSGICEWIINIACKAENLIPFFYENVLFQKY